MECTELSPYANAIRFYTGLPVFDSVTACQFFISGSKDIAIFGLQDWPGEWDRKQDRYHFGDNLVESESFSTFVTMRSLARILQKKNKSGESLEGNQKENRQGSTSETDNKNAQPWIIRKAFHTLLSTHKAEHFCWNAPSFLHMQMPFDFTQVYQSLIL